MTHREPRGRTEATTRDRAADDENDVRSRTYNYLRLSMVAVIAALAVALVYEMVNAKCFQKSVSAYYYTPVQLVFVGGLVALCVGMVALWGRNPAEDAFLNLAGLFAPVVAFVPTTRVNRCSVVGVTGSPLDQQPRPQQNAPDVAAGAHDAINNNMFTFAVVVVAGLVLMGFLRGRSVTSASKFERAPYVLSYILALVALLGGVIWFWADRDSFYAYAHLVAAVALFVCVIIVVFAGSYQRAKNAWLAARLSEERGKSDDKTAKLGDLLGPMLIDRYAYAWVGLAMILSVVVITTIRWLTGWSYWIFLIEAVLIGFFGLFWLLQTVEHWAPPDKTPKNSDSPPAAETPKDAEAVRIGEELNPLPDRS